MVSPEVVRRADGREDGGEEVQAHGELGDVRVVRVGRGRARGHVVPQVLQEQPHHAALALRPHHHLHHTPHSYCRPYICETFLAIAVQVVTQLN